MSEITKADLVKQIETVERVKTMRREEGSVMLNIIEYAEDRMRRKKWDQATSDNHFKMLIKTKKVHAEKNEDGEWTISVTQPVGLKALDDLKFGKKKQGKGAINPKTIADMGHGLEGLTIKKIEKALAIDNGGGEDSSGAGSDDDSENNESKPNSEDSESKPRRRKATRSGPIRLYSQSIQI